ncbi:hypothetical protein C5748_05480 [Phyllobacterium phragmitis]|uniref:DUF982 domain-containing protein n=1 Tax=Phyllobacterium phragmitis TaxID=2670329 RepID=A0A2S9IWC9_9HYPH|nr:DUF982 domain-containing protein [Phyllobacterium phragmitis]PRD44834.1 hypothetical protein C5748_05480 [Phyllobacterium phragmitis]
MKWNNPIAIHVSDLYYSITSTRDAESFILGHWFLFKNETLNATVMACLLSWDGNVELAERARHHFVEAARSAGILICDGGQTHHAAITMQKVAA